MFPSLALAVETMKLALPGIIYLGQNVLPLVLEVCRNKRWCVKGWMTTLLYKTIIVTLTVSLQKTKEPATLSLAHLNGL